MRRRREGASGREEDLAWVFFMQGKEREKVREKEKGEREDLVRKGARRLTYLAVV